MQVEFRRMGKGDKLTTVVRVLYHIVKYFSVRISGKQLLKWKSLSTSVFVWFNSAAIA